MKTTLAKVLLLISSNYHINYNNLSSFQKDLELERKVMQWIVNIIKEKPESPSQYDRWIQDGSVLAKLMINIVFNSVPIEVVHSNWGSVSVFGWHCQWSLIKYFWRILFWAESRTCFTRCGAMAWLTCLSQRTSWSRETFQKSPDPSLNFANW